MKAPPADDRQDVREAGFLGQGAGRDGRYGKWQMGWREIKDVRSAPWALSSLIWVYDHLGKRAYRLCIIVIVICFWATHPPAPEILGSLYQALPALCGRA